MTKNIAIIDTETGGYSTTKNGVCEVAILIVTEDLTEVVSEYSALIKPYNRVDEDGKEVDELVSYKDDAMAIHGITMEDLEKEGLDVTVIAETVLAILEKEDVRYIAGHNVKSFDVKKIEHLTTRFAGGRDLSKYGKVCSLELSKKHLKAKSYKLPDLCLQFGIGTGQSHRALSDCYSTWGLLKVIQSVGVDVTKIEA